MKNKPIIKYIWTDKKRHFGVPLSFTKYSLSEDRLFVKTGCLNEKQEEILLYRIRDITMSRGLFQKIFGVGSIKLNTNDTSSPVIIIKNIKNVENVKELIHQNTETAKKTKGMAVAEIY